MLGRGCLCDQPLVKTLGAEFLMNLVGRQHFTCVVTMFCDIKCFLCDSTGRALLEAFMISSGLCFDFALIFLL